MTTTISSSGTIAQLLGLLSYRLQNELHRTAPDHVDRAIDNARAAMSAYVLDAAAYVEAVEHMARGQLARDEFDRLPPSPNS
jgi:hypothetical protein